MRPIIKYSNGVETTTLQILYLRLLLVLGIYLSNGRAWMQKSMQDFCKPEKQIMLNRIFKFRKYKPGFYRFLRFEVRLRPALET